MDSQSNVTTSDNELVRQIFSQEPHVSPEEAQELLINSVCLRDGQQAERYSPTVDESMEYALALVRFGVQGIEAGNAPAGDTENNKVIAIAEQVGGMILPNKSQYGVHPRITSLARLFHEDVVTALQAVQGAPNRGVHTYMAHSEIQFPYKFNGLREIYGISSADYDEFLQKVVFPTIERELKYIKDTDPECQIRYSPEDWTRTRPDVAIAIVLHAAKCGADTINVPDTVGVGNPFIMQMGIAQMRKALDENGFGHVQLAFHGHNDGGMAAGNTLGAILGGAREVDVTQLGTGERGGNTSIESVIFMLDTQRAHIERVLGIRLTDTIVREETMHMAQTASTIFRRPIPEDTPIVGKRQRQQRAGVHQAAHAAGEEDGVATVYCPVDLKKYGVQTEYVIGPESGKGGLRQVLKHMCLPFREADMTKFARRMKQVCDSHRSDLEQPEVAEYIYSPIAIEITGGNHITEVKACEPIDGKIAVSIKTKDDKTYTGVASTKKEGEIDAIMQGMKHIIENNIDITRDGFHTRTTGEGSDADAISTFTMHRNGREVTQSATDTNTHLAERKALIQTFNALWAQERYAEIAQE